MVQASGTGTPLRVFDFGWGEIREEEIRILENSSRYFHEFVT
jgi:hypothetical protein